MPKPTVTVYGKQASRTSRVTWCCRELGVEFSHITEHAPLKYNPNDQVPVVKIEEEGKDPFTLYESFAINNYLCKRFQSKMAAKSPEEEAKMQQWSLWAITELEAIVLKNLETKADVSTELEHPLTAFDKELEGKQYLVGNRFTIADLNVASILVNWGRNLDLSKYQNVKRWSDSINSREKRRPPRKAKL